MQLSLFCLLAAVCLLSAVAQFPLVHVEEGALKGTYLTSLSGRRFAAFRGIPYARPPAGKYRFKEPTAIKRWPGVWNASEYGSPCLQFSLLDKTLSGSEDCLFVNIFTPRVPTLDPAPMLDVFVYIHGGGFMVGSASHFDPAFLMDNEIVVVTFNYRLGILGFLSTEDDVIPGNNGLKDQAFALKWVQRNIAAFGGNPSKITLAGVSAGAASVHFHYFSPLSQGLFQRGMSFSGTALSTWAIVHGQRMKANKLAELLGCSTYSSRDLADCLRYRPARNIVRQTNNFLVWQNNPLVPFGPTIEVAGNSPFINKHPANSILEGAVQHLPWIASITLDEGLFPAARYTQDDGILHDLATNFHEIAPHLLLYNFTASKSHHNIISHRVLEFYFGSKPISNETIAQLIKMESDRIFVVEIERAARMMSSVSTYPVYFYVFAYRGADSFSNRVLKSNITLGVSHADDSAYIGQTGYSDTQSTEEDSKMSKLMVNMCVNFANNGDPTPTGAAVQWLPLQPYHRSVNYLRIDSSTGLEMSASEGLGNRLFWDSLPLQEPQVAAYRTLLQTHNAEL